MTRVWTLRVNHEKEEQRHLCRKRSNSCVPKSGRIFYNTLESIYCLAQNLRPAHRSERPTLWASCCVPPLNDKRDVITVSGRLTGHARLPEYPATKRGERLQVEYDFPQDILIPPEPGHDHPAAGGNAIHHAAEKMLDVCVIRASGAATADGVDIIAGQRPWYRRSIILTKAGKRRGAAGGAGH